VDKLGDGVYKNSQVFSPFKWPVVGLFLSVSWSSPGGTPITLHFSLVADGLSTIINKEIAEGRLKVLYISRHVPGISHLLFTHDSLLFVEANAEQAQIVKNILITYERSTIQLISNNKCSVFFGRECSDSNISVVTSCWETENRSFEEKYLGLPFEGPIRRTREGGVNGSR
jgi:hypothetical protein